MVPLVVGMIGSVCSIISTFSKLYQELSLRVNFSEDLRNLQLELDGLSLLLKDHISCSGELSDHGSWEEKISGKHLRQTEELLKRYMLAASSTDTFRERFWLLKCRDHFKIRVYLFMQASILQSHQSITLFNLYTRVDFKIYMKTRELLLIHSLPSELFKTWLRSVGPLFETKAENVSEDIDYILDRLSCIKQDNEFMVNDSRIMFRWVALQMGNLWQQSSHRDIERELDLIPRGLDNTYNSIVRQIYLQLNLMRVLSSCRHVLRLNGRPCMSKFLLPMLFSITAATSTSENNKSKEADQSRPHSCLVWARYIHSSLEKLLSLWADPRTRSTHEKPRPEILLLGCFLCTSFVALAAYKSRNDRHQPHFLITSTITSVIGAAYLAVDVQDLVFRFMFLGVICGLFMSIIFHMTISARRAGRRDGVVRNRADFYSGEMSQKSLGSM